MKLLIVLLLVAVALVSCTPQKKSKYSTHPRHKEFCDWKTKHGKNAQYRDGSLEHDQRFLNYLTNSAKADQRNLAGGAKHGPNSLSDLTHTEFEKRNGFKQSPPSHKRSLSQWGGRQVLATPSVSLTAIDWSSSGASTPIKDQGQCGSCWAHAATETTEKYLKLTTGSSTELSQQQVIDCDTDGSGCNGGPSDLNWVQTYGGLTSSANYPPTSYQTDNQGTCQTGMQVLGQIPGWGAVDSTDESVIAQHLLCYGPLLVMVDATQWQTYTGGIMTASQCAFSSYDHAVVLTGVDPVNNYWIIQNSWGTGWGENGYIRLAYGTQTCGIQGTGANDVFLSAPTASLSTAQCLSGSSASPPSVTPPPPPPPPSVTPPPPPPSVTPTPPSPSGACTDLFMGTPCDCQDSFCNDGSGDPCCCDGEQCDWVVSSSSSSSGTDSSDSSDSSGSFSSGGWDNWAQASNTQTYNSSSSQDAGLSVSQIVGIVIGSALIALIVGFVIGLVLTKKSTAERV